MVVQLVAVASCTRAHERGVAQLKIGDIEIDGSVVRIGPASAPGVSTASHVTPGGVPERPLRSRLAFLDRVPLSPRVLVRIGIATAAVGVCVGIAILATHTWGAPLVIGPLLLSLGGGTAVLGLLTARFRDGGPELTGISADPLTERYVDELRAVITTSNVRNTVERLAHTLGWSQRDVVNTLGWLQARGELREELDVESGEFYYVAIRVARDLASRLSST